VRPRRDGLWALAIATSSPPVSPGAANFDGLLLRRIAAGMPNARALGVVATANTQAVISGKPLGLAVAQASTLIGLDAHAIRVEVCCTRGPAFFQMVGLAEAAVREARVRVASALARLGVLLDEYAITVNLAPADLRKGGAALDLAIAAAVLGAVGQLPPHSLHGVLLLGELSLDGGLQPIRGVLPQLDGAAQRKLAAAIVPEANAAEAGLLNDIDVHVARDLQDVLRHLTAERSLPRAARTAFVPSVASTPGLDLRDVRGQATARRALEIAAAGGHNLLMIGPPGGGKTLLARLLPSVLPPLEFHEAIETTAIHSVAGLLPRDTGLVAARPFRAPHHSVSDAGLVGGGEQPRPGELSLAHHGVLFLDELAEFRRSALESLRQPLEDGKVCIARARARAWFPARPVIVAAVNPCPCGFRGHPTRTCRCARAQWQRYMSRLSGPLLDRLDVHVSVPPVDVGSLTKAAAAECSAAVRERVIAARRIQSTRCDEQRTRAKLNAELSSHELEQVATPDGFGRRLLEGAVNKLGLSARGYVKVLRVARTIADLEGSTAVRGPHVAEAIQGRLFDRDA
jgi:magnesium chelatase family protein